MSIATIYEDNIERQHLISESMEVQKCQITSKLNEFNYEQNPSYSKVML